MATEMRGADLLARSLERAGARYVYSLSGNQIMPLYDAALDARLEIIHVRHEGAAVHMADAWGRLTGKPGIALVTGGPGHANAIGALYTAAAADAPVVLLSGHAPLSQLGMDAFQEMRQADMAAPVVKASWTARSAQGLGEDIARAWALALAGRPGPVHVSLPADVLEARVAAADAQLPALSAFEPTPVALDVAVVQAVIDRLRRAERPLILTGPVLAAHRGEQFREALQQASGIPVIAMESPRGVNDPALGAIADALREADVVLLLGKKLDFTLLFGRPPAFAEGCKFILIDPDAATAARARRARGKPERIVRTAVADMWPAARQLAAVATPNSRHSKWAETVEAALRFRPASWGQLGDAPRGQLHPLEIGSAVQSLTKPDDVIVIDGGEFGQWAQASIHPRRRLINGPAGSIGSAIPFALAAKLAHPAAQVLAVLGDGTFGFHMAEFDTAVRHRLPIVAVVGNDACWNAEHQIQLNAYGRERAIGCELLPTRYDQAVAGLGAFGTFVEQSAELRPALQAALASGRPACVNVLISRHPAPNVTRSNGTVSASGH